ncbi:hypothetical protein [Enhygromyxa salina]|uniref:hypothetical protein n=1 Tax=Enhygromyxa salina TaxID=215803 RepID=UPI0006977949|nr:hypothetical protein [Enhygromyxa salina]
MQLSIILSTLLSNFATGAPDLCNIVYTDAAGSRYTDSVGQALARYCKWSGPDAPVWDANVCCQIDQDGATCSVPDTNGRCRVGDRYFCEYGARVAGGVVCYQPFPSMCDAGLCVELPVGAPLTQASFVACCSPGGVCQPVNGETALDCQGDYVQCSYGIQNEDGTVECYQ